jgi:pimeloyl-[acyl-carrier protein] methyl ester esterase
MLETGTSVTFILLPGLDGSGTFFDRARQYFEPFGSINIVSYPVAGLQSYQALADFVEAGLPVGQPFVIVAESFSGPIGIELASRRMPGILALILVATFVKLPLGIGSKWLANIVDIAKYTLFPPKALLQYVLLADDASGIASRLRQLLIKSDREILIARGKEALSCDVSELLTKVDVPILSLVAKQDRLLSNTTRDWRKFLSARVVEIDGPHFLLQEGNSVQLTQAITDFIKTLQLAP